MKVLFCDPLNTQNSFYTYAKYLRQKGIDAAVVIGSGSVVPREHQPGWHDVGLVDPSWVIRQDLPYFLPYTNPREYWKRLRKLVATANKFDVIGCSGLAATWMRWSRRPFVFFSYGSDLDQLALQGWSGKSEQDADIKKKAVRWLIRKHLVGSLHKAKATVLAPYQIDTAKSIGLRNLVFLPHIIDLEVFKVLDNETRQSAKHDLHKELGCDLIFFHPSRQAWTDRSQADCKGNDKVFRAFARFREKNNHARLVCVNKGWDLNMSKKLVKELGITDSVTWLDPMNKTEMCSWYNAADVVLDQFVVGVLALVALEPLACGTPSITYVAPTPEGMFYPKLPPVVNAHDEDEIYAGMCTLAGNPALRDGLGEQGRQWVERYCSPETAAEKFVALFSSVSKGNK